MGAEFFLEGVQMFEFFGQGTEFLECPLTR